MIIQITGIYGAPVFPEARCFGPMRSGYAQASRRGRERSSPGVRLHRVFSSRDGGTIGSHMKAALTRSVMSNCTVSIGSRQQTNGLRTRSPRQHLPHDRTLNEILRDLTLCRRILWLKRSAAFIRPSLSMWSAIESQPHRPAGAARDSDRRVRRNPVRK